MFADSFRLRIASRPVGVPSAHKIMLKEKSPHSTAGLSAKGNQTSHVRDCGSSVVAALSMADGGPARWRAEAAARWLRQSLEGRPPPRRGKSTASQDEAGQSCTDDGGRDRDTERKQLGSGSSPPGGFVLVWDVEISQPVFSIPWRSAHRLGPARARLGCGRRAGL